MKRIVLAAAFAAASAVAMPALAAPPTTAKAPVASEHTSSGVVKSFTTASREVVFKDGRKYELAASVTATPKAGDKVSLKWKHEGKQKIADTLTMTN